MSRDPHRDGLSDRQARVYDALAPRYGRSAVTAGVACDVISALYFRGWLRSERYEAEASAPMAGGGDQPRPRGEAPLEPTDHQARRQGEPDVSRNDTSGSVPPRKDADK